MEDQLLRTTSNKSVDRASGKGKRSGGSMGSSLMNGWLDVVSSRFALFGNGGETTHVVLSCLCKASFLANTLPHFMHTAGGETVVVVELPFLYALAYGNFLQTLCCILNMCISSLLVMRRNRRAKIVQSHRHPKKDLQSSIKNDVQSYVKKGLRARRVQSCVTRVHRVQY